MTAAPFAVASNEHPRHSEASAVRLNDGSLLLAWSAFGSIEGPAPGTETDDPAAREWAHSRDNNPGRILARTSTDDGATWSESAVLVEREGGINVMQPAFARLADGSLGLSYSDRRARASARRVFVRSSDEGASWSAPVDVTGIDGYVTAAHDRLVVLVSGRILQPVHQLKDDGIAVAVAHSDDGGAHWRHSEFLTLPQPVPGALYGYWEASIAERVDGSLIMMGRSALGQVYRSESVDGGESWTPPAPSGVVAPSAPPLLRALPGGLLLLLHNSGHHPGELMQGPRAELVAETSDDGGDTWTPIAQLESSTEHWFHYPSCLVEPGRAFLSYSVTDPQTRAWSLVTRWLEI